MVICYEIKKKVLVARLKSKRDAEKVKQLLLNDGEEVELEELFEFTTSQIKRLEE